MHACMHAYIHTNIEQVIEIVKGCDGDEVKAAKALCDKAYELWKQEEEVVDDITAIVVFFNN